MLLHSLPSCSSQLLAAEKQKEASRQGYPAWAKALRQEVSSKKEGRAGVLGRVRMQSEGSLVGEEAGRWAAGPVYEESGFCPRPLESHERFSAD